MCLTAGNKGFKIVGEETQRGGAKDVRGGTLTTMITILIILLVVVLILQLLRE